MIHYEIERSNSSKSLISLHSTSQSVGEKKSIKSEVDAIKYSLMGAKLPTYKMKSEI
jgi:hypothetical protein